MEKGKMGKKKFQESNTKLIKTKQKYSKELRHGEDKKNKKKTRNNL